MCLFIILLVRFGLLSGHLSGKSCPLGWPCVLIVICLFISLVISRFGFEGGVRLLIAPASVHWLLVGICGTVLERCGNVTKLSYSLVQTVVY